MEIKPCILDTRQTFGKIKKKFLYRCFPDDHSNPIFVTFELPPHFQKKKSFYYILAKYLDPIGILVHNLGEVDEPAHYYEYLLHCKKLNLSQREFNQEVLRKLKNHQIEELPFRDAKVFTIDGESSIDLDDGFSVDQEKTSIYISYVPYVLDKLDVWQNMTDRISTIYMPDKRHPMLPGFLSTLCSLNEDTERPCLVLDLYLNGEIRWSICKVKIHKNYTYENVGGTDYKLLSKRCGLKDSHDVVHHYMTQYNTLAASKITRGFYLTIHKPETLPEEWLPDYFNQYSYYSTSGDYAQMTSPIRRLVDVLNMVQLTRDLNLYNYKDHGFCDAWFSKMDILNTLYRTIRKTQNTAKLLDLFQKNNHKVFEGIVWDKKVYLKEIGLLINYESDLDEFSTHLFQLYLFHDESQLKRKIRIQKV